MLDLSSLNTFDYAVLVVLVLSGILATFRGMTREFLGLTGWGIAVLAARLFQPLLTSRIEDIVGNESATEILSFALPFVIVVIVWFFFANIVAPGLKKITFGRMDRLLGFFFGLVRGFVLVALVYVAGLMVFEQEGEFPEVITDSVTIMPTRIVASAMVGFAPEDFREDMQESIPEQDVGAISKKIISEPGEVIDDSIEAIDNAAGTASENLLPDEVLTTPGETQ